MRSAPLRAGIIGCGNVTMNSHIPALLELDNIEVVAVTDLSEVRRDQALKMLALSPEAGFDSHSNDFLAGLDYALVAVPPVFRKDIILDCAREGVHVLSEKPLSTIPVDADAVIRSVEKADLKIGLVHNYLYYSEYVQLRQLIESGEIGAVRQLTLNFLGVPDYPGSKDYQPRWRHDPQIAGGGVLMDMIHVMYVAEFLMGEHIESVSAAIGQSRDSDSGVEDLALVLLSFPNGYVTINIAWGLGPGGIEVTGEEGRIMLFYEDYLTGPFAPLESITLVNEQGRQEIAPATPLSDSEMFAEIHKDFAAAIQSNHLPIAPASDGQRVLEATLAAYSSAVQGCVITLPLAQDNPVYLQGLAGLGGLELRGDSSMDKPNIFTATR